MATDTNTPQDRTSGTPDGARGTAQGATTSADEALQLAQAAGTSDSAPAAVTITPPPAGGRAEVTVEAGGRLVFQGVDLATAQIQQFEGGLLITLANGGVIFLAGYTAAAESANPPVVEVAGIGTIDAGQLLAATSGGNLDIAPGAGPAAGVAHGGGAAFATFTPGAIGDGLAQGSLQPNEDFLRSPPTHETLPVADDEKEEGSAPILNSEFSIQISGASSTGVPAQAVTLQEDSSDSAEVTIAMAGDPLVAGQTATVVITIGGDTENGAPNGDFTQSVADVIAAAANSVNIDAVVSGNTVTLTWDATDPSSFSVLLTADDDALLDSPETLVLTLSDPARSGGTAAIVVGEDQATATIEDLDQDIVISIADTQASISEEAGGSDIFTISLSEAMVAGNTVTVDVDFATGTDTEDADFVTAAQAALQAVADATAGVSFDGTTLTFTDAFAGTDLSFAVTAADDDLTDSPETLTVTLSNATAVNGTATAADAESVTVTDIDADVTFAVAVTSGVAGNDTSTQLAAITEEAGPDNAATYTINLGGDALTGTNTATVTVSVSGSAIDGIDLTQTVYDAIAANLGAGESFNPGTGELTFDATSDGVVSFTLTAFDDTENEAVENLIVTLSGASVVNGSASVVSGQESAQVDITDTELPVVGADISATVVEDELPGGTGLDPASVPGGDPLNTTATGMLTFSNGTITGLAYSGAFGDADAAIDGGTTFTINATDSSWSMVIDKTIGAFTFTLNAALDHLGPNLTFGDDTLSGVFTATVENSDGSVESHITVTVHDDGPPVAETLEKQVVPADAQANVMLVLDVSGSMGNASGLTGLSRLDVLKASVNELLDQYDSRGEVKVRIVTFASGGNEVGSVWMMVDEAKAAVDSLTANGSTNYDAALLTAMGAFADSGALTGDGVVNVSYFISDGDPTASSDWPQVPGSLTSNGIQASEQVVWEGFLTDNGIVSYALGIPNVSSPGNLNPIAFDPEPGTQPADTPIIVNDLGDLAAILVTTIPPVTGNLVTDGSNTLGADGGYVLSISADGTTYTFDPEANGGLGGITVSGGPSQLVSYDGTTKTLVIDTAPGVDGGEFSVVMTTGVYIYNAPAGFAGESVDYVLVDGDGDAAGSTLILSPSGSLDNPPVVRDDHVFTNQATVAIPAYALLINDTDANGDVISVTGTSGASGGTVSGPGATVTFTDTGSAGGSFVYTGSTSSPAASDTATVTVTQDTNGVIDGDGLGNILIGGSGNDTLNGHEGDDVLIAGGGSDTLSGGDGRDTFMWSLEDIVTPGTQSNILLSTTGDDDIASGYEREDIAQWDGTSYSMFFDGSASGFGSDSENIDAVHVLDNGNIVVSTTGNGSVAGLNFDAGDLVEYNPGGSTVNGLAAGAARHYGGLGGSGGFSNLFSDDENIDALHILDNGHIILSTSDNATLGGLNFEDGDLVEYDPTTGTASLYFDEDLFSGSADIDAVHILDNGHIILSTDSNETLGGLSFNDEDLVEYDPVAGTASLYFDGSAHSLSGNDDIDAVHIGDPLPSTDTITDFVKSEDVLHFADVFDGGAGDGLSLSDLIAGGFIGLDSSADIGGGGANDTVITIDADGSAGGTYAPVVAVNVLDVTLTAADTNNFIV